ncbi:hypothetical protein D1872_285350 [compost metagenome]
MLMDIMSHEIDDLPVFAVPPKLAASAYHGYLGTQPFTELNRIRQRNQFFGDEIVREQVIQQNACFI